MNISKFYFKICISYILDLLTRKKNVFLASNKRIPKLSNIYIYSFFTLYDLKNAPMCAIVVATCYRCCSSLKFIEGEIIPK